MALTFKKDLYSFERLIKALMNLISAANRIRSTKLAIRVAVTGLNTSGVRTARQERAWVCCGHASHGSMVPPRTAYSNDLTNDLTTTHFHDGRKRCARFDNMTACPFRTVQKSLIMQIVCNNETRSPVFTHFDPETCVYD